MPKKTKPTTGDIDDITNNSLISTRTPLTTTPIKRGVREGPVDPDDSLSLGQHFRKQVLKGHHLEKKREENTNSWSEEDQIDKLDSPPLTSKWSIMEELSRDSPTINSEQTGSVSQLSNVNESQHNQMDRENYQNNSPTMRETESIENFEKKQKTKKKIA